jgi:GntR family transcriptional regulator, transcriptional repressor for pyruvate dehydrogenase complex
LVQSSDQFPLWERWPSRGNVMSNPAVKTEFEAVRRNRIYEEIARQIQKMIAEKMKPGDMLPPERQLAEMFQVSRSSIRDAIRTLELSGLVEARQGLGTVVHDRSADVLNPLTSVLVQKRKQVSELLDVRKMIEPPLASRAAVHATAEEVAEMDTILRRQQEKMQAGELAIEEDNEFHYAIALAADNSVVLKVLDILMDLLRDTRERSLQVEGRPERSMADHREILDAIKHKDAGGAEAAMRQHIEAVEKMVLTKL